MPKSVVRPAPAKGRSVRVPDPEWEPAMERARVEGLTLTDVIRHYLREYVAGT